MRFEVKGGGIAAIVFAIILLSGAVFVLGLLAGYDVGRQAQLDTAQLATSFPLQSPPVSNSPSKPPAASSNSAVQSAAMPTTSSAVTSAPVTEASAANQASTKNAPNARYTPSQPSANPGRQRLASTSSASEEDSPSSTAGSPTTDEDNGAVETTGTGDQSSAASSNSDLQARRKVASSASSTHRKPYNIEIQAAMDISGADQMMARLEKLGYPSHLVPTEIAGQRWYKVEVGPYATTDEASSAEAQLRQRYDAAYGAAARGNNPAQDSANNDSEE
jgi:septal ring-binding cell division protein DamX